MSEWLSEWLSEWVSEWVSEWRGRDSGVSAPYLLRWKGDTQEVCQYRTLIWLSFWERVPPIGAKHCFCIFHAYFTIGMYASWGELIVICVFFMYKMLLAVSWAKFKKILNKNKQNSRIKKTEIASVKPKVLKFELDFFIKKT